MQNSIQNSIYYYKKKKHVTNEIYSHQKDDLHDVQMTRLATWRTALMMSLQLLPGQNLIKKEKNISIK